MWFNPENDADWMTYDMKELAAAMDAARKDGVCPHNGVEKVAGMYRCADICTTSWRDEADWLEARDEVWEMYA